MNDIASWMRYGTTTGDFYATTTTTSGGQSWAPPTASTYTIRQEPTCETWRPPTFETRRPEIAFDAFETLWSRNSREDELLQQVINARKKKDASIEMEPSEPCSEQELSDFIGGNTPS